LLQILKIVTFASVSFFIGFYLSYLVVCIRYRKAKNVKPPPFSTSKNFPAVSIIIPTYNEAEVISRKMADLQALNYPKDKLQIVFVDGGSTDGTAELIENSAKDSGLSVAIVQQGRRKGFNKAVIEGFAKTTGEIVCITGAETEYDPEALNVMVEQFNDPRVGAVTGKQKIKNVGEGYSPKLEVAYRSLYDLIREAESCIDSPFDIKGEISAARRNIVARLVKKAELFEKGCIDCCISFQAKMDGYTTVYEPKAAYYELSPKSIRDSFKQQIRRAATLIENMMAFKDMILNKKFGAFGMLIMPAHFLMLVILPFLLLIGSIGMAIIIILDLSNYLLLALVGIVLLAILVSSQLQAFLKTQIVLVIATLKFLVGTETQKFERLSSTRV
jgi:cellulose synthase/poly-beta-1,6-N-acetylglucosamine synthase-like glycosyltransferase